MRALEIGLFAGSVLAAPAETLLVLVPEDERPLRGDAGLVDWRLCGGISTRLLSGYVTGRAGEAVLLPGGGPLAAERVLLIGAGPTAGAGRRRLLRAMRTASERLLSLRSPACAFARPGSVDFERDGVSLLRGLLHGLAAARAEHRLRWIVPDAARQEAALIGALTEVVPAAQSWGVEIEVDRVELEHVELPRAESA